MVDLKPILLLGLLLMTCCSSVNSVHPELPLKAAQALSKIEPGMGIERAKDILASVSIDWGQMVLGGSGTSIYYFQVSSDLQYRIEVSGFAEGYKVLPPGGELARKTEWRRIAGRLIYVDDFDGLVPQKRLRVTGEVLDVDERGMSGLRLAQVVLRKPDKLEGQVVVFVASNSLVYQEALPHFTKGSSIEFYHAPFLDNPISSHSGSEVVTLGVEWKMDIDFSVLPTP